MHKLEVGIGISDAAALPAAVILMMVLASTFASSAAAVGPPRRMAAGAVPLRRRTLGRLLPLRDGLAAGRGPAALGAAVLVTGHLAHLDEAAVEAGQVLQGAVVLHVAALILSRRGTERGASEHHTCTEVQIKVCMTC